MARTHLLVVVEGRGSCATYKMPNRGVFRFDYCCKQHATRENGMGWGIQPVSSVHGLAESNGRLPLDGSAAGRHAESKAAREGS